MPLSKKDDTDKSKVDKIESMDEVVKDEDDGTQVISVKLSKDKKDKTKDKGEEKPEEEKDGDAGEEKKEKVDEKDKGEEKPEKGSDLGDKQVSSFSQLDSDKVIEEEEGDDKDKADDAEKRDDTKDKDPVDPKKSQEELTKDVKKWLEDIHPEARPEDTGGSRFSLKSVFFVIFLLLVLALIIGGFAFYQSSQEPTREAVVEPTKAAESVPTPTPTPTTVDVDLTEITVQVLNGTGIAGEAGRTATELESAGFVDVTAGNASSSGFEETVVEVKGDVHQGVFQTIETTLSDRVVVIGEEVLDEDNEYDVIVTVGSSEKEEEPEE
ncbi:LytR C-terminal domain-containing protein [Patescibacteria group bacterium]